MIYVGANDGMLHAIDGSIDAAATGGTEVFAYLPSLAYSGPTVPKIDGLRAFSDIDYAHRSFVNATPRVGDVDFARTSGATGASDCRSVLVGGMGGGGQGFFAIGITDPSACTSETAVAGRVLWEFTDPDIGFSAAAPQVVKTARWGWVVLLTSGHNNHVRAHDSNCRRSNA